MAAEQAAAKTLLVIEDNAIIREGMAFVLRHAGYTVHVAENGRQGLELLRDGLAPHVILLDMMMPIVDGWAFLLQLKAEPRLTAARIIVITGTALTREWAAGKGCAGFLRKPIESEALLDEVQRCIAGTG